MVTYEDALDYIENNLHIKFYEYQKRLLKNIIDGKITNTPRGCGLSFVIDKYAKYLNYKHWNSKCNNCCDDYVSFNDVMNDSKEKLLNKEIVNNAFKINEEIAKIEYNIDYDINLEE